MTAIGNLKKIVNTENEKRKGGKNSSKIFEMRKESQEKQS